MMQGAISSLCVYLGHELGLYKTLHKLGPSTPEGLAAAAGGGLSERWVREWLYQQAASRLVCCDGEAKRCVSAGALHFVGHVLVAGAAVCMRQGALLRTPAKEHKL